MDKSLRALQMALQKPSCSECHGTLYSDSDDLEPAVIRDALRYRWLKENAMREHGNQGDLCIDYRCRFDHFDDVDASIDADMICEPPF